MESFSIVAYLGMLVFPAVLLSFAAHAHRILSKKYMADLLSTTKGEPELRFPGPMQLPIIGRIHDLPVRAAWIKMKEWADEYGPIYQTSVLGEQFLIISDEEIGENILTKKGNYIGGRTKVQALMDHKIRPTYLPLQDRTEYWRRQKKWVHAAMVAAHSKQYHGIIEHQCKRYLASMVVDPAHFHEHTRELNGRIMSSLVWDDPSQANQYSTISMEILHQLSISGPIVNTVQQLWHLAEFMRYNPWRKYEEAREARMRGLWNKDLQKAKDRFLAGELPETTVAYRYLNELYNAGNLTLEQEHADEHNFAVCMLGFACTIGVITVTGPLLFFLMAMGLHPEALKSAQEEVDRVCGDRMPCMNDYADLPTIRACVKESIRWRSTVPLGVPHQCETSTEYNGIPISKGTVVIACSWAMNRDESKYPDAENFRPERWLEPEWPSYMEPLSRYPSLREGNAMHAFGYGRRRCLGISLSDYELFVFAACVCWGFNISERKDPLTGEKVAFNSQAVTNTPIVEPMPWPMDFEPRSKERARAMMKNYTEAL